MSRPALRRAGRRCSRALLAAAILAPALHAQARDDAQRAAPILLERGRFHVLLATPSSLDWASAHDGTARAIAKCASALRLDSASVRGALARNPWAAADSTELPRSELVVQVVGQPLAAASCGLDAALDPGVIARGVALVAGRYADSLGSVGSMTLRRSDGSLIAPERTVQSTPTYLGSAAPAGGAADPLMERGYFALGSIAPRRDGTLDSLLLVIVSASGDTTRVPISGSSLERLWPGIVAARVAASAARSDAPSALRLPLPRDPELRVARDQFASGATRAAALRSSERLGAGRLTADDELAARLMMSSELLAEHDTLAAAATLAPALRATAERPAAPCLQLAAAAPHELRALVDELRPSRDCVERGATRTMLKGLLIPGGGQTANGQRASGYIVAGFVVAAGAGALALHQRANQQYRDYQAETYPIRVQDAYRRANGTRHLVVAALTGGAAVWGVAAIEAGVAAAYHDRAIRRARSWGVSAVAREGGDGIGLGVAVSFGRGHS